jgi:hypothetical protein
MEWNGMEWRHWIMRDRFIRMYSSFVIFFFTSGLWASVFSMIMEYVNIYAASVVAIGPGQF